MAYPHNRFAPVNIRAPEPVGICQRCAFLYPLSQLVEQQEWRGPALGMVLTHVCVRTCLDRPNEQLRTIVIGPDLPPRRPSPTFYDQQNAAPGFTPGLAPLSDDEGDLLIDDFGNPILAG